MRVRATTPHRACTKRNVQHPWCPELKLGSPLSCSSCQPLQLLKGHFSDVKPAERDLYGPPLFIYFLITTASVYLPLRHTQLPKSWEKKKKKGKKEQDSIISPTRHLSVTLQAVYTNNFPNNHGFSESKQFLILHSCFSESYLKSLGSQSKSYNQNSWLMVKYSLLVWATLCKLPISLSEEQHKYSKTGVTTQHVILLAVRFSTHFKQIRVMRLWLNHCEKASGYQRQRSLSYLLRTRNPILPQTNRGTI